MDIRAIYERKGLNLLAAKLIYIYDRFQIDQTSHTVLTTAVRLAKWNFVKELLTNLGLKTGDPLVEESLEGVVDVHPVNDEGQSALVMIALARLDDFPSAPDISTFFLSQSSVLCHSAIALPSQSLELILMNLIFKRAIPSLFSIFLSFHTRKAQKIGSQRDLNSNQHD